MKSLLVLLFVTGLFAKESDLEKRLEMLNIPDDRVTPVLEKEKLKIVNKRYSSLLNRHEVDMYGANDFNADSHMLSRQAGLSYRYHLNPKWSFGARYTEYFNELSEAGRTLFEDQKVIPDKDFAIRSSDAFVNYNTTYGKFRLGSDQVVYFDQYIALGYGTIALASGETNFTILDLGLSFWLGKNFSMRAGLKNEFYEQVQVQGNQNKHNAMGYLSFGYLFGGDTL